MIKISEIIDAFDQYAPFALQENYDNSGLLIGDKNIIVKSALLCIDLIEEVVDEAITRKCDIIISHHPFIFSGIKKINSLTDTGRVIQKLIKNDIAVLAVHTNLDNAFKGVSTKLALKLGIKNISILSPLHDKLSKLIVFVPNEHAERLRSALFQLGAGNIGNYDRCSFNVEGVGTFRAGAGANPFVGTVNELHTEAETRIETLFPSFLSMQVVNTIRKNHPYEEPAFDIFPISNVLTDAGAGVIGEFETPLTEEEFLCHISNTLKIKSLRHTKRIGHNIKKVALCGGSGASYLLNALAVRADAYISADFKYHQFFEAENKILVVDAGHFETEQFTTEIFYDLLIEKFPKFAVHFTETITNPINYYSK